MHIPKQAIPPMEWNGINNNIYTGTSNTSTKTHSHSIPYHSTPLKQEVDRFIKDIRSGNDRSRSIRELTEELGNSRKAAEFKYYADRKRLLQYFSVRPR